MTELELLHVTSSPGLNMQFHQAFSDIMHLW